MNGWTLARIVAPRAVYRARFGHWCDHQDVRLDADLGGNLLTTLERMRKTYGLRLDAEQAIQRMVHAGDDGVTLLGWGPWELVDLGRQKVRHCCRCGHMESTYPHPMRDMARELADRPMIAVILGITATVALLALLTWLMLWVLPTWADVTIFVVGVLILTRRK